jgi:formate hydrogenlyase subunit 3/multisubunit Na+/H+ antiporter MnhD subunit
VVVSVFHPLNIFIVGLGGGFLIPLLNRLGRAWLLSGFIVALAVMTLVSGVCLLRILHGAPPIDILTGGSTPPYSINLRMGLGEAVFAFSVNLVALIGAGVFAREKYGTMLLYLLLVMGIQGMIMTRDLFNLFVFLEIVSISTYGLLSLQNTALALSAAFKYLMATVLASTFFLVGAVLLYAATGMLNIDDLIARSDAVVGPLGFAGLMFVLACLLVELKPFPANGWGLDVYETARSGVAALVSGGVSAGVLFALLKLLPLFKDQLELIAALSVATFLFSNLIGLQQTKAQRLLGYSSVAQMGLLTTAACLLQQLQADSAVLNLVVGGLFVNHLFAKIGLFWLAGHVGKERLSDWSVLVGTRGGVLVFGVLMAAIAGFPPFPGFWAKWQLVMSLAASDRYAWIAIVLLGSLLEAAYLFRWFGRAIHARVEADTSSQPGTAPLPVFAMAALLAGSGYVAADLAGLNSPWVFAPLVAGLVLYLLDGLDERSKCLVTLALVLVGGLWLVRDLSGISGLFAVLLLAGGFVISIACLYRSDRRPGFYPLLVILLLSLPALPCVSTSLEFFMDWELITLSSYFLILRRREAEAQALPYLLFSLVAASFLLVGFAMMHAGSGSISLSVLHSQGSDYAPVFILLAIGLLIKAGAIGVHVWLPGAYAEADDDVSALLSAVVSKAPMFGLLVATYVAILSEVTLNLAHVLGWIGILTTLVGAMLAVRQDDMKRMLAYSSMSQLGYIIAAIGLMSHLGWVTALYLVANHLMVKGILFLAAAGIILRTGRRSLSELGGLATVMPFTLSAATIAVVAMSGLPPLAGFGAKWLLLSAMLEKGWYGPAIMTLLATFVGFLYMARFIKAIFLGSRRAEHDGVAEAPLALLAPQCLLIAGILVMSFFPKLLIEPISKAIDPQFASTLVWQGMSLQMIYGVWNPLPVMAFSVAAAAVLFVLLWLLGRTGWLEQHGRSPADFYDSCRRFFALLTPPWASTFWVGVARTFGALADRARLVYTGDGQTYNLYILSYFLVLYILGGGLSRLWPSG